MPLTIIYEQERRLGGTPFWESKKSFTRLAPNRVRYTGKIRSEATYFMSKTPCLEHDFHSYVKIKGTPKYDFYLCEVVVTRRVWESARKPSIVKATGSISWQFTDNNNKYISRGIINIRVAPPKAVLKTINVFEVYHMIIPHNVRTYVSSSSITGAMQIRDLPSPTITKAVVIAEVDILYAYIVFPLGGYTMRKDGSMSYTPFKKKYKYTMVSGKHVWREEPDFKTRFPDKQPPLRKKVMPVYPKKKAKAKETCTCSLCQRTKSKKSKSKKSKE